VSNRISGVAGYRTDDYLYLPLGLTARTRAASHALSFKVEYDRLHRVSRLKPKTTWGYQSISTLTTAGAEPACANQVTRSATQSISTR
jgi:hypothetical protein